jgi:hypothetical protein
VRDRTCTPRREDCIYCCRTVATEGGRTTEIVGRTTKERAQKLRVVLSAGWLEFLGTFAELRLFCKGHDNVVHFWHDFLGHFGIVVDCTGSYKPYNHGTISKTRILVQFSRRVSCWKKDKYCI